METKTILWVILAMIGITFIIAIIVFFKKFFSSAPTNSSGNSETRNSFKKTFSDLSLKSIIIWLVQISLIVILTYLVYSAYFYFRGDDSKEKSKKTITCNIPRISEVVSDTTYVSFNYEAEIETQGDSLYFQFPKKEEYGGGWLPKVLWTGKGTYDLVSRETDKECKTCRGAGPVKVWPPNPGKSVWLKISEVRTCEE